MELHLDSLLQLRLLILELGQLLRKRLDEEPGDRRRVLRGRVNILLVGIAVVVVVIVVSFVDAVLQDVGKYPVSFLPFF